MFRKTFMYHETLLKERKFDRPLIPTLKAFIVLQKALNWTAA